MSSDSPIDAAQSARRQAEVARDESERRYKHLFEHSLGLICVHDLDGRLVSVNPAAARSLGYEPAQLQGRHLGEFLSPDIRHLLDSYLDRIRARGSDGGLMRVVSRDGAERVWMYQNVRYDEPGVKPCVIGHALDITDRIRAERALRDSEQTLKRAFTELDARVQERTAELQQANRLKEEFLATLSHELRTPLNAILGWAHILRTRPLDQGTLQALAVIERNARAQTRLIEDMLDVSRIAAGKVVLNLEATSMTAVVEAALDSVRPAAEAKSIGLIADTDPRIEPIQGDSQRLQQVVWNLLSNAIKFTPPGGTVTVAVRQHRTHVELTVTDTGAGIHAEVLPFIFDRFRQADSSTTRSHGGLGLGLAIVRHVVELHGGTVSAQSAGEGRGATFRIALPTRADVLGTAVPPVAADDIGGSVWEPLLQGRRVLVVEDHADARQLIAATVEAAGASALAASSSREAFDLFLRSRPDVVIADIGLPEEDGYALLRRIRSLGPERGGNVPAIALTAYARAEDREEALTAGYQRHVAKPVDPQILLRIVAATLGEQPAKPALDDVSGARDAG